MIRKHVIWICLFVLGLNVSLTLFLSYCDGISDINSHEIEHVRVHQSCKHFKTLSTRESDSMDISNCIGGKDMLTCWCFEQRCAIWFLTSTNDPSGVKRTTLAEEAPPRVNFIFITVAGGSLLICTVKFWFPPAPGFADQNAPGLSELLSASSGLVPGAEEVAVMMALPFIESPSSMVLAHAEM